MKPKNIREISLRSGHKNHTQYLAQWQDKRAACIATLREPKSVGYTARLHGVPETAVRHWQIEERIPTYTGPKLRMPDLALNA